MAKEILVTVDLDETRAAILEDGELAEVYFERPVQQRVVGNIYKGRVENVLPGMQAAFVDIGLERNAFLYVDDAIPYGDEDLDDGPPVRGPAAPRRAGPPARPGIRDVVRPGQEILVQVVKEPIGTKGARVTRHITLPGRYVVLVPGGDAVGVSRRIANEKERERLKAIGARLRPEGAGLIIRTVAEGAAAEDLERDLAFLHRLWERIQRKARTARAPALVHQDLGLLERIVRDALDDDVAQLVIDQRAAYDRAVELVEVASPHLVGRVRLWTRPDQLLFDAYGVDHALDKALRRRVWLKSGGYIVIDQTEALTAIDVNTGKYVGTTALEDTVFKTNLEAAREIARQLRLRDIGGIIIIDFIDMEVPEHRQAVLRELEEALRKDRTRTHVLGLTQLGLVELTRKKSRQALDEVLTRTCHTCDGRGRVLNEEAVARRVRAEIRRILKGSAHQALLMEVHPAVAALLIGPGGANLRALEQELGKHIYIRGNASLHVEKWHLAALGDRAEVEAQALPVRPGQVLAVRVEEPHAANPTDGIARVDGYILDIEGAGGLVGRTVQVEVTRAFRTYARARLVGPYPHTLPNTAG